MLTSGNEEGRLYVSAISIWEIGVLVMKNRIAFKKPILQWIQESLQAPHIHLVPLSPEISLESCDLPSNFHQGPAERIIVASARILNVLLVTKVTRILQYANEGYLKVISA